MATLQASWELARRAGRHGAEIARLEIGSRAARRALRRRAQGVAGIDDALELAAAFRSGQLRIAVGQVRSEIAGLLALLREDPPRTVLEIGTAEGGTLFLFAQVAAPGATLVSLDLPSGLYRGRQDAAHDRLYRGFARDGQRVEIVRGDSHDPATLAAVRTALRGADVDFLFIDGDHSYEGVKQDFEMYAPLVRSGGLIGLHDIVPYPELPEAVGGVPDFWRELAAGHRTEDLVESWEQGGFGIGLVHLP